MRWSSGLLLTLIHLCVSKPLLRCWDDVAEKHSWVEIPQGWKYHSPASADHSFEMRLGLKQDKIDDLISSLMEISDPNHERYGAHLTQEEAAVLVAPHPDTVEAVDSWLDHCGIKPSEVARSANGDWLTLRVSVAQAERMLDTKYNVYYHPESSRHVVRALSYSLPRDLHSHIDVVTPTTYFGSVRSMRATSFLQPDIKPVEDESNAAIPSSCSTTVTPACLRALYNTTSYVPVATNVNKLGIAGYLEEFANRADFTTFLQRFRSDATGATFTTVKVNGGGDNQSVPGIEANLDIQYAVGMSFPTPNTYYSTGGSPPFIPDSLTPTNTNEPYLDWLNFILAQSSIPQTLTTSYGDDEQTVPLDYATKVCNMFAQLGSLGSTVLFSSGDFGVGGGTCATNDGTNRKIFQPIFPASCPFVTAVGGTTRVNPEIGVSLSGGGFSNYFPAPSYQTKAVLSFVTSIGTKYAGLYNKTGRAYPDVAAQASGFQVILGGRTTSVGGTSAASPTVAGVIALLNDFRLSTGKSSLGFINPLIYSTASSGFNDIVSGSNPGCGTTGFTAVKGWDPVTGLGTPDFLRLKALV